MYYADNLKKKIKKIPFEINFLQLVTEMCTVMKKAFSQVPKGKGKPFQMFYDKLLPWNEISVLSAFCLGSIISDF